MITEEQYKEAKKIVEQYEQQLNILAVSSSADVDKGHGLCKEKNCNSYATKDYNGHEHWVCDYHYNRLNNEFDEEYR